VAWEDSRLHSRFDSFCGYTSTRTPCASSLRTETLPMRTKKYQVALRQWEEIRQSRRSSASPSGHTPSRYAMSNLNGAEGIGSVDGASENRMLGRSPKTPKVINYSRSLAFCPHVRPDGIQSVADDRLRLQRYVLIKIFAKRCCLLSCALRLMVQCQT
jgi:hypothetical protein